MKKYFTILLLAMYASVSAQTKDELIDSVKALFAKQPGVFAMAYRNMQTGETVLLNAGETFHAASTMKTPVMIELFKQERQGRFRFSDSIEVKNEFKSIVDGSTYTLNATDDSYAPLYQKTGQRCTVYELMYRMIIHSSNLATNILIGMVDGKSVTQTMRSLGAKDIQVRRGVEDSRAFQQGLNNTTTAYDLMLIYDHISKGDFPDKPACDSMINILLDQEFRSVIPALLPQGVRVAHKTGSITGVQHDSGIVFLPDGRQYVLVLLSRELTDTQAAIRSMAGVSALVYRYFLKS